MTPLNLTSALNLKLIYNFYEFMGRAECDYWGSVLLVSKFITYKLYQIYDFYIIRFLIKITSS